MLPFVNTVDAQAEQHMRELRREAELQHLKLLARAGRHATRRNVLHRSRQHGDSRIARHR